MTTLCFSWCLKTCPAQELSCTWSLSCWADNLMTAAAINVLWVTRMSCCCCYVSTCQHTLYSWESREVGFLGHWRKMQWKWGSLLRLGSREQPGTFSSWCNIAALPIWRRPVSACHREISLHPQISTDRLQKSHMPAYVPMTSLLWGWRESERDLMIMALLTFLPATQWTSTPGSLTEWSSSYVIHT